MPYYPIVCMWNWEILSAPGQHFCPSFSKYPTEQSHKRSPGTCAAIFLPACPGAMSACYFGKEATLQTGLFEHKLAQAASLRARWQRRVLPVVEHTPTRPAIKKRGEAKEPRHWNHSCTQNPTSGPHQAWPHCPCGCIPSAESWHIKQWPWFVCLFIVCLVLALCKICAALGQLKKHKPKLCLLGLVAFWWKYAVSLESSN